MTTRLTGIGRCSDVGHGGLPDNLLEILGNKLGAMVEDDPRGVSRKTLLAPGTITSMACSVILSCPSSGG